MESTGNLIPFREAARFWTKLGFINFGGPAGQIAIMHEELVDRKQWISNERFLHALNFCMLLPGPEAQQLAIYIGWLLNGVPGGMVAGVMFVLPAFFLILGLSWTYVVHGDIAWVAAVFYGLRGAVIALVLVALVRVGSKALKHPILVGVAVAAFVSIFFLEIPFPLIVAAAAAIGLIGVRLRPEVFSVATHGDADETVVGKGGTRGAERRGRHSALVLAVGLVVWWAPLLLLLALRGTDDTLSREALFFSHTAMITFGGAYAVLAYINEAAVEQFGWLEPGQMVAGLGLAESTPGPLIMVTQFVGFLAAYRFPGGLDPVVAGTLGALVTVWATFVPCFLWIFLGAPYIEQLRGNRWLSGALSAVTAAVVGVILNLAVTFALVTLFSSLSGARVGSVVIPVPVLSSVDLFALGIAIAAFVTLWRFRIAVPWVLAASAGAGLLRLLV